MSGGLFFIMSMSGIGAVFQKVCGKKSDTCAVVTSVSIPVFLSISSFVLVLEPLIGLASVSSICLCLVLMVALAATVRTGNTRAIDTLTKGDDVVKTFNTGN